MTTAMDFNAAFEALTDYRPLRWQRRLFDSLCSGPGIPGVCDLPTGLGKTSVIPIFIVALACQSQADAVRLPRRLVYVVNRRTVVDQATDIVQQIRDRLLRPDDPRWREHEQALCKIALALRQLGSAGQDGRPLAVSTLRGELADNEEWKADPARPAIIVGTIDMIGSKLLFSGYGDGRYWRAQHAGLIGQDSLIIHDEAHLTPAFGDLLRQVANMQSKAGEPRPIQVMELSATSRSKTGAALRLEPEDEADQIVRNRLGAAKYLHLHHVGAGTQLEQKEIHKSVLEKIVHLSLGHREGKCKVLIYVRSPEDAQEVASRIEAELQNDAGNRVALLTGTIRGHERDRLVREHPVYTALMNPSISVNQSVYLVSTSAGEVGIDIDADHMVGDLTTLDSLIQRLGRVNRRGGQGRVACIDVVAEDRVPDKGDKPWVEAVRATHEILKDWAAASGSVVNAAPRSIGRLLSDLDIMRRDRAFTPRPAAPILTDILLDTWSLTTIAGRLPGKREVAPYLHGLEREPPETYVAWRAEIMLLRQANVDHDTLGEWFQNCRIESRERLRDYTYRVKPSLGILLKEQRKKHASESLDFPVAVLDEQGRAEWRSLSSVTSEDFNPAYRTLVLPVDVGGLTENGALDSKSTGEAPYLDVAQAVPQGDRQHRQRVLERWQEGTQTWEYLDTKEVIEKLPPDAKQQYRVTLADPGEDGEAGGVYLLLLSAPRQLSLERPEAAGAEQTLELHGRGTRVQMNRIAEALCLEGQWKEALTTAAEQHDLGKDRPIWQRYAGNADPKTPLAKFTGCGNARILGGYRHEFGSALDAGQRIQGHSEADLVLHLIAAHHGWARPHFERKAWDNDHSTTENEEAAGEIMRRFARLQERFGHWGLAWIESLLRCADITASNVTAPNQTSAGSHEEAEK